MEITLSHVFFSSEDGIKAFSILYQMVLCAHIGIVNVKLVLFTSEKREARSEKREKRRSRSDTMRYSILFYGFIC